MERSEAYFIVPILKRLNYEKIDRIREIGDFKRLERLESALRSCINGTYAILFFPNFCAEFTPYGYKFNSFYSVEGETNYLLYDPELDEKFLRKLFTGIELIIYLLCKIVVENDSRRYSFETEKTVKRLNKLQSHLSISDWKRFKNLFDDIFHVRNAFAHSFIDVEDIEYKEIELKRCFGNSYRGRSHTAAIQPGGKSFIEDVREFMNPIMDLFLQEQLSQIDVSKLFKSCDSVLKKRSLGPD